MARPTNNPKGLQGHGTIAGDRTDRRTLCPAPAQWCRWSLIYMPPFRAVWQLDRERLKHLLLVLIESVVGRRSSEWAVRGMAEPDPSSRGFSRCSNRPDARRLAALESTVTPSARPDDLAVPKIFTSPVAAIVLVVVVVVVVVVNRPLRSDITTFRADRTQKLVDVLAGPPRSFWTQHHRRSKRPASPFC